MSTLENRDLDKYATIHFCRKMATEAKINRLWINVGKEWYTHEEFPQAAERNKNTLYPFYTTYLIEDIKLRDPRTIIEKMNLRVEHIIQARDEFLRKVKEYYK
ncbi:MAG: hypothetical protein KL787_08900 [Taibaiella sp.]|nr:hypothetical protein [Taibaiella sp.]